jgi:hypothetical protein
MSKHRYGIERTMRGTDFIVRDDRNGRVLPAVGPGDDPDECFFSRKDAEEMAKKLNDYVLRNKASMSIKESDLIGPFFVHPASMRKRLEGRKG